MPAATIKDSATGETLPGAVVTILEGYETRATTDEAGKANLPAGKYTARMIGYTPKNFEVKNSPVNVAMEGQPLQTAEVIIEGKRTSRFNPFWILLLILVLFYFFKRR